MNAPHYLIVGQGVAGTLLAYRLLRAGARVHCIDAAEQVAASSVAAGVVNPLTGRRFVRSWRIDELLPEASKVYQELEASLGIKLWYELPLVRTLHAVNNVNDWSLRTGDRAYTPYVDPQPDTHRLRQITTPVHAYAGIRQTARVDVGILVFTFKKKLEEERQHSSEAFDLAALSIGPPFTYQGITYAGVIFSEGWRVRNNPWFDYLPHRGNKGEALSVSTPGTPLLDCMFKNRIFLVPRPERGDYWVGATNRNQFTDEAPGQDGADWLAARLDEVLAVPYKITGHTAAVRPTVRDRRPLLGEHPTVKGMYIFNGLGSKGASLAPLCSKWLCDHLLQGTDLPSEVDIKRFS